MAALALNCPHCSAQNMGMQLHAAIQKPNQAAYWSVLALCAGCNEPIAIQMRTATGGRGENSPLMTHGNLKDAGSGWIVVASYPQQKAIEIPNNIPMAVAKAFRQAAESRRAKHFDAAAAMYRKAMELALKDRSPEIDAWKIEKRIDKMADAGLITKEMQAWAHELRLDGNDAVHDDEITAEVAEQMDSFCTFLLTYLFTLPEEVKLARERRADV